MRTVIALAFLLGMIAGGPAAGAEISSAYTEIETDSDCAVFAAAGEEAGDWANLTCSGWRGYPVLIYYSDARESVFYGFPPPGDMAPVWESFSAFNHTGPTVEWRLADDGTRTVPFATIHRWFVQTPEEAGGETEVLVVEKVGRLDTRRGCAVGYVVATGNPNANEKARQIADNHARGFNCGDDEPVVDTGRVPVPPFHRVDN